jgi:hypothetical protein
MAAQLSARNGLRCAFGIGGAGRAGDDLLAAAGFAFDQHREGRVGVLPQLQAQLLHRRAVADQRRRRASPVGCAPAPKGQRLEHFAATRRGAGLGDKIGGAERAGMARIAVVVLAGEDDDLDVGGQGEQVGNQREPSSGRCGSGGRPRSTSASSGGRRNCRAVAGNAGASGW